MTMTGETGGAVRFRVLRHAVPPSGRDGGEMIVEIPAIAGDEVDMQPTSSRRQSD
jgi:hypothetical protein